MNLIRLIKLKKIYGELDDLTKQEWYFVSLFENLNTVDGLRYKKDGLLYFYFNLEDKELHYNYSRVYMDFKVLFNMNMCDINTMIGSILEKKLDVYGFTVLQHDYD